IANAIAYPVYRVTFPTVADINLANSMQIAEVELLAYPELTATNDAVSASLPAGANEVNGVANLFDRQLDYSAKLEVESITNADTVVHITLANGPRILKGFQLIGAADDFDYPERRPSSVTLAGAADRTNFITLSTVVPVA